MSIGENVKYMREKAQMTQEELSKKVGVKQHMISQIERGTKTLTIPLAMQIAEVLECSILDLASSKRREDSAE